MNTDRSRKKRYFHIASAFTVIVAAALMFGVMLATRGMLPEVPPDTQPPDTGEAAPLPAGGVVFAPGEPIHDSAVMLELTSDRPAAIYYTLDGKDPTTASTRYTDPISLLPKGSFCAYSIKAKAFYVEGGTSDTACRTYIISPDISGMADTPIFAVTTEPDNVFGHENGIFVPGKIRADFLASNPGLEDNRDYPANYFQRGRAWEREMYLEVIDPVSGVTVSAQNAGIRTYGGWSRVLPTKSVRLFARSEYDVVNDFEYTYFGDNYAEDGTLIRSYKRMVLRTGGNDFAITFMRDELLNRLTSLQGYEGCEQVRPCVMLLNGEVYGCYWLHEYYDDSYYEAHYGEHSGEFIVMKGAEKAKEAPDEGPNQVAAIRSYNRIYAYAKRGLNDEKNYERLCNLLDVEDYLTYCAMNLYIENADWPQNNNCVGRYFAAEGEEYAEDGVYDGRWRYMMHDTDWGFGLCNKYSYNCFDRILNPEALHYSMLFTALMEREDCRAFFIGAMYDVLNGAFSSTNLIRTMNEMHDSRELALKLYMKYCPEAAGVGYDSVTEALSLIKKFAERRPEYMRGFLASSLGAEGGYSLRVRIPEGVTVDINSYTAGEGYYSGIFAKKVGDTKLAMTLHCNVPVGFRFSHWTVDGEAVTGETLDLSAMITEETEHMRVAPVIVPADGYVTVYEVAYKGDSDYITLFNPGSTVASMAGMVLTDGGYDPDGVLHTYTLPSVKLEPGDYYTLLCENYSESSQLHRQVIPFNLSDGETVIISRGGETVCSLYLPQMGDESLFRLDSDGMYREYEK